LANSLDYPLPNFQINGRKSPAIFSQIMCKKPAQIPPISQNKKSC